MAVNPGYYQPTSPSYKPLYSEEVPINQAPSSFPNPPTDYFNVNTTIAFDYGSAMANREAEKLKAKISSYGIVEKARKYFMVDTKFVLRKLLVIFCPFIHQDWSTPYDASTQEYNPSHSPNAVDLYVPVMSFLTYLLITSISLGYNDRFTPQALSVVFSLCLGVFVLEVAFFFLALFVTGYHSNVSFLSLVAICGYKYTNCCFHLLSKLLPTGPLNYIFFVYFAVSYVFFSFRTLRWVFLTETQGEDGFYSNTLNQKSYSRIPVLICIAVIEPIHMFWITRV